MYMCKLYIVWTLSNVTWQARIIYSPPRVNTKKDIPHYKECGMCFILLCPSGTVGLRVVYCFTMFVITVVKCQSGYYGISLCLVQFLFGSKSCCTYTIGKVLVTSHFKILILSPSWQPQYVYIAMPYKCLTCSMISMPRVHISQ